MNNLRHAMTGPVQDLVMEPHAQKVISDFRFGRQHGIHEILKSMVFYSANAMAEGLGSFVSEAKTGFVGEHLHIEMHEADHPARRALTILNMVTDDTIGLMLTYDLENPQDGMPTVASIELFKDSRFISFRGLEPYAYCSKRIMQIDTGIKPVTHDGAPGELRYAKPYGIDRIAAVVAGMGLISQLVAANYVGRTLTAKKAQVLGEASFRYLDIGLSEATTITGLKLAYNGAGLFTDEVISTLTDMWKRYEARDFGQHISRALPDIIAMLEANSFTSKQGEYVCNDMDDFAFIKTRKDGSRYVSMRSQQIKLRIEINDQTGFLTIHNKKTNADMATVNTNTGEAMILAGFTDRSVADFTAAGISISTLHSCLVAEHGMPSQPTI